jgi:hypothetical protein
VQDRIAVEHSAARGVTEQHANIRPVICAAFRRTRKRAKPVVQFFNGDSGDWPCPKVTAKSFQAQLQIGDVFNRASILAFRFQHFFGELRYCGLASADTLQVINKKADCVIDRLAVLSKLVPRRDEIR